MFIAALNQETAESIANANDIGCYARCRGTIIEAIEQAKNDISRVSHKDIRVYTANPPTRVTVSLLG